jgi:hypothetical protein
MQLREWKQCKEVLIITHALSFIVENDYINRNTWTQKSKSLFKAKMAKHFGKEMKTRDEKVMIL